MTLPYSTATSGKNAMNDIEKTLKTFGCNKFGSWEDYDTGTMTVQFEWDGKMVELRASASGYAAAWLKENPWTSRRRSTEKEWSQMARDKGVVAVYSILRDWIKAQVTAIETGLLTFEGVFMPHMLLADGSRLVDHVDKLLLESPSENGDAKFTTGEL